MPYRIKSKLLTHEGRVAEAQREHDVAKRKVDQSPFLTNEARKVAARWKRNGVPWKKVEVVQNCAQSCVSSAVGNGGSLGIPTELIANITGQAKRVIENGKEYLVAPLSLIVPGVLPGSKGSLYYPPEEVRQDPAKWDNFPLTVGHPTDPITNQPIPASDHGVFARQGIGHLRNTRFSGGKLKSDGYFDVERTRRVDPDVLDRLERGEQIQLSTGLYTDNEPRQGAHNGRPYTHIARNYRPDHCAILPHEVGACSLEDGCGVFNSSNQPKENKMQFDAITNQWVTNEGEQLAPAADSAPLAPFGIDHTNRSKEAARRSVLLEHSPATKHALAALDSARNGDAQGAAQAHWRAAIHHEKASDELEENRQGKEADRHKRVAHLHRQAASHYEVAHGNQPPQTSDDEESETESPDDNCGTSREASGENMNRNASYRRDGQSTRCDDDEIELTDPPEPGDEPDEVDEEAAATPVPPKRRKRQATTNELTDSGLEILTLNYGDTEPEPVPQFTPQQFSACGVTASPYGPAHMVANRSDDDDYLPVPTINFTDRGMDMPTSRLGKMNVVGYQDQGNYPDPMGDPRLREQRQGKQRSGVDRPDYGFPEEGSHWTDAPRKPYSNDPDPYTDAPPMLTPGELLGRMFGGDSVEEGNRVRQGIPASDLLEVPRTIAQIIDERDRDTGRYGPFQDGLPMS